MADKTSVNQLRLIAIAVNCFVASVVLLQPGVAQGAWENALKPEGKPAGKVTVVGSGRASATILVPTNPTSMERKAAADLQLWFKEITGVELSISSGKPPGPALVIRTDRALGSDGYEISLKGDQLGMMGGTGRGVVNAVYALLEEDLGCRFYTKDSVRLPATKTLVLTPVARRVVPALKIRDPFYAVAFDPEWSLRNRTDAPSAPVPDEFGGRTDYDGMFVHTAAQMVPEGKYFKDHPEYFALKKDGKRTTAQLCATEPGVTAVAISYVREMLRTNPHTEIVSVSKNDNTEVCHCDRCEKLRETEGSDMANQLVLVNQVAEAIEAEFPNVAIDTLAYLETIRVPKTARPRKNVVIRLCNDAVGAWTYPFKPAAQCEVAAIATAWGAAHRRIYIWDYNVNFSHYLAPMPNLSVMAGNIRFWAEHSAEGVMLQGGYQGPAERDELKSWVTAKLLLDPRRDYRALRQDFVWGYYGAAAPALEEYEALLDALLAKFPSETAAPAGGIRYAMDAPFLTKDFVDRSEAILARAKRLAGTEEQLIMKVERARLPVLYVQCVRGPEFTGPQYGEVVADFERIARACKLQHLQEGGPDFEQKLAGFKKRVPKAAGEK